ncbi:hypothetical protein MKX08_008551 [Trichoderma sp. CBMAI-0020]|nr:hypothetical protein MKX08_008551 [Trichoderma sp. CBMAI-0020]
MCAHYGEARNQCITVFKTYKGLYQYLPTIYTAYQYEVLAIPQSSLMYRDMYSLSEVARMPNGSKLTAILHGGPVPRPSVDLRSINHGDHGKQYREYNDSASEEKASAFNSCFDGNGVPTDMINNNNNGIQRQRHKTRSLLRTAIPDLVCPVTNNNSLCKGHLLKIKDEFGAESHSLAINTGNNAPDDSNSISQAFKSLHNSSSTHKAEVKYMCMTQMQNCFELCIGNGSKIPRWRKGSEIFYVICTESFETPGAAALVSAAMTEAISMWGNVTDVVFREVGRDSPATFRIKYKESHNSHDDVYAMSFPPKESASSLVVYQPALEDSISSYLANILAHELGHILGLRHEFALQKERGLHSVRFGSENHQSVMNYFGHPSKLQVGQQDREELAAFYAYSQVDYEGLPIINITPRLRRYPPAKGRLANTCTEFNGNQDDFALQMAAEG